MIGITPLGLDHTTILGKTLPEIASAKAGIMKPGCLAYTVNQETNAFAVLQQKANDIQVNAIFYYASAISYFNSNSIYK